MTSYGNRSGAESSEVLSAYLDGELDAASVAEVERRLAADPELRGELERLRAGSEWLAVVPEPDPAFVARTRERREAVSFVPRWTWRQLGVRLAAAAVVTVVAVGVSLWQGMESVPAETLVADESAGDVAGEVAEESLLGLEGQVLGASGNASAVAESYRVSYREAAADNGSEPVLLIALGASFPGETIPAAQVPASER